MMNTSYGANAMMRPPAALVNSSDDPFSPLAERHSGYVYQEGPSMDDLDDEAMRYAYSDTRTEMVPLSKGKLMLSGKRRRLNAAGIALAVAIPYALYVVVVFTLASRIHYESPLTAWIIELVTFVVVCIAALCAMGKLTNTYLRAQINEPSWTIFLALTLALAWLAGTGLGEWVFEYYFRPYWDLHNLNNFTEVNPQYIRGQMMMDAGYVSFVAGTKLDIQKSMGFRSGKVYCVAPISFGESTLNTYDFWAVGTDCCSGNQADYHCENYNTPGAQGALRLVGGQSDKERPFYRLAVQQAEAAYDIRAVHPLFFRWVSDPASELQDLKRAGNMHLLYALVTGLLVQLFLVACATLAFGKLGR